ncbi:hypothetical protein JQ614_02480 [Bradyrhizobium diazoefficiens]|uniref:hypothetical protein n=1 Tax=Bradyrhizobium diazoefficiens TaxID=1355477 RepID=UPI001B8CDF3F|nr:hypothetical protein [Bradyrhizobium diazoefficiens]MBR0860663.1 hypothetical protein [Bradyrhizobium diazoefficiens]MBR0885154.1 hypothetical protein [Bradyrhizobium diazoefficiens]MBR0917058.1 hypothetical protein [Bradyrhizobium diazoefficiens]
MILLFRLYGEFDWPPHPTAIPDQETKKRGTIELYYTPNGDTYRAFIRWVPQEIDNPPEVSAPPDDAHIYKIADAAEWFAGRRDQVASIWIDEQLNVVDGVRVAFRGAFLIDQYQVEDGSSPPLDLRWPLVKQCEYREGVRVASELVIYRSSRTSQYRLNLHLPLPLRRTTLTGASETNPPAFPFCVVYQTNPSRQQLGHFTTLVGGWIGGRSFEFTRGFPQDPTLGHFGLAARAGRSDRGFAVYDANNIDLEYYWPSDVAIFTDDLLKRYGFTTTDQDHRWLKLRAAESTADLSLRFPKPADPRSGSLVYRVTAIAASANDDPSHSDLRWKEAISLHLSKEIGGWLKTGKDGLYADCELAWDIPDDSIWEDRNADWSLRTTLRLHWDEKIIGATTFPSQAVPNEDLTAGTLRQAAYSFNEARDALKSVEVGQPQSVLPEISVDEDQTPRFMLYGSPIGAAFVPSDSKNDVIVWGRQVDTFVRPAMRLSLAAGDDLTPKSSLKVNFDSQTLFTKDVSLAFELQHDDKWPPQSESTVANGEPFFASFNVVAVSGPNDWSGRLSSLSFRWHAPWPTSLPDGILRTGGPGDREGFGDSAPAIDLTDGHIAGSIQIFLPVTSVEPVGVDVSRTDRTGRPAPLLIPVTAAPSPPNDPCFYLQAVETISTTRDRSLEVEIFETRSQAGERSYVILSQEPFSVLRFTHVPLGDRGDEGSSSVAIYSDDDRIWRFKLVSDLYHYVLPPQSIGESADKPHRLEIQDLLKAPPDDGPPPQPFVVDLDNGKPLPSQSGLKRRAVEFRLTPSAEIWIRPSDVERGYFMPEQASYDIFRQRGEYGLGAAVSFIRAEFLYGLPVGIDVSKESSIARQARIAEIEALTGTITGTVGADAPDADKDLAARWNDLARAVARRPERLEIWARDPDSAVDFTPARFSQGVSFALRGTALPRPALPLEFPENYTKLPKVGGLDPAPGIDGDDLSKPRHHPQGLSGGALWPVESVNLYNILMSRPQSQGGTIESIAFSPIGGDATQKAEFLNGIVTVISETRNGFVERQKVEVIGRVCAHWHRAKHVVVYERTVNPSAQFAPRYSDDPEPRSRSRRPILRKVREYVELLQPERAFPDFANATARSAGFLDRVRFNQKTINVDSAWSSDVGTTAWQIPLWNRLSARERPQVYPMPDVAFVTAAEGDGDKPVVAQECLDTDFLFFYADFGATTSDTDQWAALLDIDYTNMPVANAFKTVVDPSPAASPSAHGADPRRPSVSRFLPGLRRFTWRLAPAAQKTAINAGRIGKPVYVGVESITFERATHVAATLPPGLSGPLTASTTLVQAPDPLKDLGYWKADGTGSVTAGAADYADKVKALKEEIKAQNPDQIKLALQNLANNWGGGALVTQLRKDLNPNITKATDFLQGFKQSLGSLGGEAAACDKLKSDAIGAIQRKEMLIRSALTDWATAVAPLLVDEQGTPITKATLIDELVNLAIEYLKPLFAEASQDVGKLEEGIERARAVLLDVESEFDAVASRAQQRIDQFVAAYDREKPWSAERKKAFHAGLRACIGNVAADIVGLINEARQRFAAELNDATQAIGGHLARALSGISDTSGSLLAGVGSLSSIVQPHLEKARDALERLTPLLDTAINKIAKTYKDVDGSGVGEALKTDAKNALTALSTAAVNSKTAVTTTVGKLDILGKIGDDALDQVDALILDLTDSLKVVVTSIAHKADQIVAIAGQFPDDLKGELLAIWPDVENATDAVTSSIEQELAPFEDLLSDTGQLLDLLIQSAAGQLSETITALKEKVHEVETAAEAPIADIRGALDGLTQALAPAQLLQGFVGQNVLRPAVEQVLQPLTDADLQDAQKAFQLIRSLLIGISDAVSGFIQNLNATALGAMKEVSFACAAAFESVDQAKSYIDGLVNQAQQYYDGKVQALKDAFGDVQGRIETALGDLDNFAKQVDGLLASINAFDSSVRGLQNDLARTAETGRMYADRIFAAAGRLDQGGALAVPSNILKLYSAVTSAPEIAGLKADIDRIRSRFDELSDIIGTTEASALFNRMGDELKALGLSLPFDKIGDRLLPVDDLSSLDFCQVFRHFGGAKLDNLLKGYKVPDSVRDAVRITHDFEQKQARAWVQVDINAPMPGRRSLFALGPFQADLVDMVLLGQVRLVASKDQDQVTETGFGRIAASIDVVVGGQSMVRFDKFALNFTRESGLQIEFDPKSVRLNPCFEFIQDFLSALFPDDIGGLTIIKLSGIPVGIEHQFALPPMALNIGTSGVSNISIGNRFRLVAYPDFMLADRFNLSTVERPFIFSIFIIGGTGFIQVEAEYRPFDSELSVAVDAGAGGSASLAFAFGPFSGQVFITLSGVLTYRKVIGRPGGGLSIAAVLVIAGHVDVAGIVTIGITLMLRMTYRDTGQIDAYGTLEVEIRISRFFKITARADVQYKLRGGRSETSTSVSGGVSRLAAQSHELTRLQTAVNRLQAARK